MSLAYGFDAAYCPNPVPATLSGQPVRWCEVYIGGSSATRPNGWDKAELDRVASLRKLPVWVPTPGFDNPRQSALAAVNALKTFGVPAFASPWRALMVDLETGKEPDQPWLSAFRGVIEAAGYDTMPYGSVAWLFGYLPYTGYVVADPGQTGAPHLYNHPNVAATQYAWSVRTQGGVVDADVLDPGFMPHLGAWG